MTRCSLTIADSYTSQFITLVAVTPPVAWDDEYLWPSSIAGSWCWAPIVAVPARGLQGIHPSSRWTTRVATSSLNPCHNEWLRAHSTHEDIWKQQATSNNWLVVSINFFHIFSQRFGMVGWLTNIFHRGSNDPPETNTPRAVTRSLAFLCFTVSRLGQRPKMPWLTTPRALCEKMWSGAGLPHRFHCLPVARLKHPTWFSGRQSTRTTGLLVAMGDLQASLFMDSNG